MSEAITESEVRHIATLARLKLTDSEVAEFAHQLASILDYVSQLEEVNVEGVEPTAHAVDVSNVFRADQVAPSFDAETAVANAPQRHETYFKVPKVLDQDTV
jgi:aspartyl-tRNA(Asn)/glutamyl-tRNA(Gln) amidotransferase subunit C